MPRAAVPLLLGAMLAACGENPPAPDPGPPGTSATSSAPTPTRTLTKAPTKAPTTSPSPAGPPGTTVTTGDSAYGRMLFDRTGQAIYLFDKEKTSHPRCYGGCAEAWPPVLTAGEPRAAGGVQRSLLGTAERRDGSLQVTYGGHPLYYYAHEGKHQVLCHDVAEFGGLWLVVQPDGDPAPG